VSDSAERVRETAARVVRAKAKIRDARIPYPAPASDELPQRLDRVLRVVYLLPTGAQQLPPIAYCEADPARPTSSTLAAGASAG
jgi:hypothetical protein